METQISEKCMIVFATRYRNNGDGENADVTSERCVAGDG